MTQHQRANLGRPGHLFSSLSCIALYPTPEGFLWKYGSSRVVFGATGSRWCFSKANTLTPHKISFGPGTERASTEVVLSLRLAPANSRLKRVAPSFRWGGATSVSRLGCVLRATWIGTPRATEKQLLQGQMYSPTVASPRLRDHETSRLP